MSSDTNAPSRNTVQAWLRECDPSPDEYYQYIHEHIEQHGFASAQAMLEFLNNRRARRRGAATQLDRVEFEWRPKLLKMMLEIIALTGKLPTWDELDEGVQDVFANHDVTKRHFQRLVKVLKEHPNAKQLKEIDIELGAKVVSNPDEKDVEDLRWKGRERRRQVVERLKGTQYEVEPNDIDSLRSQLFQYWNDTE